MSRIENQVKGRVTISRWTGGDDPRCITVRLIDDSSGIEFISINLTPEEFALALTGQGHVDCGYTVRGLKRIGTTSENKTEIVPYANKQRREHDKKALAALEVDGWEVRKADLTNHHRWGDKGISCVFFRLVGTPLIEREGE